jgi:hypothetical protein
MTRFLADEDFNNDILRGLLRRLVHLDVVRVQDIGLRGADDDTVLERAVVEGRVLLTHDVSTLIGRAFERIRAGSLLSGVIAVAQSMPVGSAIEDLVLVIECSVPRGLVEPRPPPPAPLGGRHDALWALASMPATRRRMGFTLPSASAAASQ